MTGLPSWLWERLVAGAHAIGADPALGALVLLIAVTGAVTYLRYVNRRKP